MADSDITINFEGNDDVVSIIDSIIDGLNTMDSEIMSASNSFDYFQSSIDSVNSAPIDEVSVSLDSLEGSSANATSSMSSFAETSEETSDSTDALSGALGILGVAASATSFASAIMGADEMNVKLDTLAGITGISSDEMNALKKSASSALAGTGVGAKEATVALMQFEQRTGTSNDAVQGFSGSLSSLYVAASRAGVSAEGFANSWSMAFKAWDKGNDVSPRVLKNLGLNADAAAHLKDVYTQFGPESEQFTQAMKQAGDQAADTASKTGGLGALMGEFKKILGGVFSLIDSAVLPAATGLAQFIGSLPPEVLQALGIALVALGAAFAVMALQITLATVSFEAVSAPVLLVTAAIAALVLGIIWAYQNVGWFRDIINEVYSALQAFYTSVLEPIGSYLMGVFSNAWKQVSDAVNSAWTGYIQPFINWLSGVFRPMFQSAGDKVNWFGLIWTAVTAVIQGVINRIILYVQTMWTIVTNIIGIIGDLLKGDWASAWNRAGTIVDAMVNFVRGMIGNIPGILWGVIGAVASAAASIGRAIFDGIVNALKGLGNAILNAVKNAVKSIPGVGGAIASIFGWGSVGPSYGYSSPQVHSRGFGATAGAAISNVTNNDNSSATVNYNIAVKSETNIDESRLISMLNNRNVINQINTGLNKFK